VRGEIDICTAPDLRDGLLTITGLSLSRPEAS
jgi:hypothetical protein